MPGSLPWNFIPVPQMPPHPPAKSSAGNGVSPPLPQPIVDGDLRPPQMGVRQSAGPSRYMPRPRQATKAARLNPGRQQTHDQLHAPAGPDKQATRIQFRETSLCRERAARRESLPCQSGVQVEVIGGPAVRRGRSSRPWPLELLNIEFSGGKRFPGNFLTTVWSPGLPLHQSRPTVRLACRPCGLALTSPPTSVVRP